VRERGLRGAEHSEQVDFDRLAQRGTRQRLERAVHADAGVDHRQAEPARPRGAGVDCGGERRVVAHVGLERGGRPARSCHRAGRRLQPDPTARHQRHPAAAPA
jgi:hypothetical protein